MYQLKCSAQDMTYRMQDQLTRLGQVAVDFVLPLVALVALVALVTAGIVIVG